MAISTLFFKSACTLNSYPNLSHEHPKVTAARAGRNPRTGETIQISGTPVFREVHANITQISCYDYLQASFFLPFACSPCE